MKLKRLVAVALIGGMVAGGVTVAEGAKKKKKKKPVPVQVDTKYFLRADGSDNVPEDNLRLSIEDGADAGNGYGWAEYGLLNEVTTQGDVSEFIVSETWPAVDGLPLKLDASKNLTGSLYLTSWNPGGAAGQTLSPPGKPTVDISFAGEIAGEEIDLGSATKTYDLTPTQSVYEVPFEIDLADEVDKKTTVALVMTVTIRGASYQHGSYELDDPASFVVVPNWIKKR
jgi:hypothetical protein